jgi:hypothetical protein
MARGGQGARLAELRRLPDSQFARIKPVVTPAFEICVEDGQVVGRYRKTGAVVALFALEDQARLLAFNLFEGRHTLAEVGEQLAGQMGWDNEQGFARARDLFVSLVGKLVCLPMDPPQPAE